MTNQPLKPGRYWTEEQEAELRELWKTDQPVAPFAQKLRRSPDAVKMHAYKMNLPPKPPCRKKKKVETLDPSREAGGGVATGGPIDG